MNDLDDAWQQDEDVADHSAHDQPTLDDRIELLLQMQQVIEELAADISSIYQVTTDERASGRLGLAVDGLIHVIEHLEAGRASLYSAEDEAAVISSPAQLAAADFPDSQDRHGVLTASTDPLPPASGTAARHQADALSPQSLGAENFPLGSAASLHRSSGIEDSPGQSAYTTARRRPDETPEATLRRGQR